MWKIFIILLVTSLYSGLVLAQTDSIYLKHYQRQQQLNKKGMYVLGGWALTNFAVSALALRKARGVPAGFYRMNIYWNLINAGLVSATLVFSPAPPGSMSDAVWQQQKIEKLFLANAALDLAYMAGGLYLTERSRRSVNPSRIKGYGHSVIVQGGFLFLFDAIMYFLQNEHGKGLLRNVSFSAGTDGPGIVWNL